MLVKKDHICLFVDGFGVEIHKKFIEGTKLKNGDSISMKTLNILIEMMKNA